MAMERAPRSLALELGMARHAFHTSTFAGLEERHSLLTGLKTYQDRLTSIPMQSFKMAHCSNFGKSVCFLLFE